MTSLLFQHQNELVLVTRDAPNYSRKYSRDIQMYLRIDLTNMIEKYERAVPFPSLSFE